MRRVAIVGAGQTGLHLALGLLAAGYRVTLVADRSPDEVRNGPVSPARVMFATALRGERDLGLGFWERQTPTIEGVDVSVSAVDGARPVSWLGRLERPASCVDQRVKLAGWMETFAHRGGQLVLHTAGVAELEMFARSHDLVVVTAGRGALADLFPRNAAHSPFRSPQRVLATAQVHGLAPGPDHGRPVLAAGVVAGVGELVTLPALTTSGRCDVLSWAAVPGGPADVFAGVREPEARLRLILELAARHLPREHARAGKVELTDARATLVGGCTPVVRRPVATLPSGRPVLGAGEAVVRLDPTGAQVGNAAARCASTYLHGIIGHGDRPFDRAFMERVFAGFWSSAGESITRFAHAMLVPPSPHAQRMIEAAEWFPRLADRFVNGFDQPARLQPWFYDPVEMTRTLAMDGLDLMWGHRGTPPGTGPAGSGTPAGDGHTQ